MTLDRVAMKSAKSWLDRAAYIIGYGIVLVISGFLIFATIIGLFTILLGVDQARDPRWLHRVVHEGLLWP